MSQNTEEKTAPNRPNLLGAGADAAALPDEHPRSAANAARRRALRITERDALGRVLPGSINVNGGRPKGATVTTLARTYTDRAIELLGAVMEDERSPQAARVTAAQALLDRGWGKAPIQIDLNVRAKFDDFLRDVGVLADHQRDQGLVIEAGVEAGLNGALEDEIEDLRPITDE